MKNFLKKCLLLVLVAILAAGTIGTYLPGASAEAEATEAAETPKYMAKIVKYNHENTRRLAQKIKLEPGTYTISFKMYIIEKGIFQVRADEDGALVAYSHNEQAGKQYNKTGTFSIDSTKTIFFNIQCNSGQYYIWDLSLTAQNSDKNLLENANFMEGDGSWIGWKFTNYNDGLNNSNPTTITTVTKSHELESATGRKVILYNEDLFSQDVENRELLEATGDPLYMARMVGSAADITSGNDDLRIQQNVTVDPEKTYTLSYNVYIVTKGNIQGFLGGNVMQGQDVAGSCVTKSIESIRPSSNSIEVRFETNKGESYIWGITLTEDGGDGTNLIVNPDFTQGSGSWIGWTFTSAYGYNGKKMTTIEESKTAETTTQRKIVPYGMFASSDIATWSSQPILEETLDFNYKTAITATMTGGTTPSMTFKMLSDEKIINVKTVSGVLEDDGRYSFSFEVLPQQMAYNIIATLSVTTSSGVQIQMKEYSVKEYCAELLADDSSDESLKDLIADLLRYGAQTQVAFNQADTITSGLSDSMSGYGSEALLTNAVYVSNLLSGDNTNATYKWKSASLVLDGKVTIRLKFTASDVTGLTVKIGSDAYEIHTGDGYYYVDIPMMATAFDKIIIAQFFEGDAATGATLSYSVNTYLYRKQNSEKEGDLLLSVYRYGQSADSYYAYLNPGVTETLDNEIADNWDL